MMIMDGQQLKAVLENKPEYLPTRQAFIIKQ